MKIKFLDLGQQPLANKYLSKNTKIYKKKENFYKLEVLFDKKTKLVSLKKKISLKKMFDDKYPYRSSLSLTMLKSFKDLSKIVKKKFKPNKIMEIGSNDGALIKNFNKKKVIAVEPCGNLAKITKRNGFTTYNEYWNFKLAKKIKLNHHEINLIYSANTITHIKNLNDVFKSISYLLSDNGVLIIEDPSLLECIKKVSYDQFYNEHIYILSAIALKNIIKKFNLEIFDIEALNTHGGSSRYYIKKTINKKIKINNSVQKHINLEVKFKLNEITTYYKFQKKIFQSKKKLNNILIKLKNKKYKIIGYGATAKAATILNYCDIDKSTIDYFLDTTPGKINKLMPGTNIPIKKYNKKLLLNVKYVFLGAWNFKKEIFKKEYKFIKKGGKFITHVPVPRII